MGTYTQTTTFVNGATADGGQVNTEIVNLGSSVNNIVNAQIASGADIAIAKIVNGSDWATWSPTFASVGAGTLSAAAVSFARWRRIGNTVEFKVDATHTITGANATDIAITFTLPVNTTAAAHTFTCLVKDPGDTSVLTPGHAIHIHATAANKVYVYKTFSSASAVEIQRAWTSGTLREVWVQGSYEIV